MHFHLSIVEPFKEALQLLTYTSIPSNLQSLTPDTKAPPFPQYHPLTVNTCHITT